VRITSARKIAVLAAVVLGTIGLGAGEANAATPTRVTRSSKNFTVTLKVTGGANFQCANIVNNSTGSVSANVGTTNIGAGRNFTCTLGTQKITLNYGIINTYSASRFSSASHQYSLTWTANGSSFFTCKTWTKASEQGGTVSSTFNTTWNQLFLTSSNSGACSNVTVSARAEWVEGWSAS
jgi:hypothetical protein